MTTTRIQDYLGIGLLAARPATLALNTAAQGLYFASDTQQEFVWNGTTWVTAGGIQMNIGGTLTAAATLSPGSGVTFSGTTPNVTISASGGGGGSLLIENQGTSLGTATTLNAGSGITAALSGGIATLTSSGGGSGGSGLFAPLIAGQPNTPPTTTSTGYSTWTNQGSAVFSNGVNGALLYSTTAAGNTNLASIAKAAPSTAHFTTTIGNVQSTTQGGTYSYAGIGFVDASGKLQIIVASPVNIYVQEWASNTSFTANNSTIIINSNIMFLRIKYDGTNVYFQYSADGDIYYTVYSFAAASGYLSSYTNQIALILQYDYPAGMSVFYYKDTIP